MNYSKILLLALVLSVTCGVMASTVWGQGRPGRKGRGPMHRGGRHDAQFERDRDVFHFLLSKHQDIRRTVTKRDDGVETLTESDDPAVAAKIQEHVGAMYSRVKERRPIRRRDPLFDELFRHTGKIDMNVERTKKGVKVIETSKDLYVVRLIQEHARVVSLFVKHGHAEARKNHAIPESLTAHRSGLDPAQPFPFAVEGTLTALEMHVINGACPIRAKRLGVTLPENQQPYRDSLGE